MTRDDDETFDPDGPVGDATEDVMEWLIRMARPDMDKALAILEEIGPPDIDVDAEEAGIRRRHRARLEAGHRVLSEYDAGRLERADLKRILREAGTYDGLKDDAELAVLIAAVRKLRRRRN
jgi:hypothetical protein